MATKKKEEKKASTSGLTNGTPTHPFHHLTRRHLMDSMLSYDMLCWSIVDSPVFSAEEEKILEYWACIDAFKTSLKMSEGKPEYTFYGTHPTTPPHSTLQWYTTLLPSIIVINYKIDGPPFATGLPHYGHILAGTIKVNTHYHPYIVAVTCCYGWSTNGTTTQDIVTRFAHQTGHHVSRRFGWDWYSTYCDAIWWSDVVPMNIVVVLMVIVMVYPSNLKLIKSLTLR